MPASARGTRRDLLEARRQDIEETAGSRFLKRHKATGASGCSEDLIKVEPACDAALVAALGPLRATRSSTPTADVRSPTRPSGDGAICDRLAADRCHAVSRRAKAASGRSRPNRLPAGSSRMVLREVYLVRGRPRKPPSQARRAPGPRRSSPPKGVLVGPAVIQTAKEADARAREIRAELAGARARPPAGDHEQPEAPEGARGRDRRRDRFLANRSRAADGEITSAAERLACSSASWPACRKERSCSASALDALESRSRRP